jgi:hypothetical protein
MYIGSDDGVYHLPTDSSSATPKQVLETGRVMRLTQFEAIRGIFAATQTGLYRRLDGEWKNLEVPQEQVYAVGATRAGRLFAGTRPAAVYTTASADDKTWEECDGLQQLPSVGSGDCHATRTLRRYAMFMSTLVILVCPRGLSWVLRSGEFTAARTAVRPGLSVTKASPMIFTNSTSSVLVSTLLRQGGDCIAALTLVSLGPVSIPQSNSRISELYTNTME